VKYENKESKDANNRCCELGTSTCRKNCDNIFHICLDNSTFLPLKTCSYGKYTSKTIHDDDFEFKDNELDVNLAKPYQFKFDRWMVSYTTIENQKQVSGCMKHLILDIGIIILY